MKLRWLILVLLVVNAGTAQAEHVSFQHGDSLQIALQVGAEREVRFPEPVSYGQLSHHGDLFRVSVVDARVYITASTSFSERVLFRGLGSSVLYVINFHAEADSVPGTITIHALDETNQGAKDLEKTRRSTVTPVQMSQFASQSLYAPDVSLIESVPGIRQVNVDRSPLTNFYINASLSAKAHSQWHTAGRYITAVELTNRTALDLEFEPCRVRGNFEGVSMSRRHLRAAGHFHDSMMVYFISTEPFAAAASRGGRSC